MGTDEDALRRHGLRLTQPRRRLVAALRRAGHATPEQLAAAVAQEGPPMALSTVYRNLEALAEAGLVTHTHLDHGPPSYHLVDHGVHLHLLCTGCGAIAEADPSAAAGLAGNLRRSHGFVADVTHMAIHGRCADCARSGGEPV